MSHVRDTQRDKTDPASSPDIFKIVFNTTFQQLSLKTTPDINMVVLIVIKGDSWSGQYPPVKSLFSSPAAICKPKQSLQTLKWGEL